MKRIAIGTIAALLATAGLAFAGDRAQGRVAVPEIAIAKPGACVAPTADMRRNHMKYAPPPARSHGARGPARSALQPQALRRLPAARETGSVLGKDGFCASCHAYASVSIDCFECHSPMRR